MNSGLRLLTILSLVLSSEVVRHMIAMSRVLEAYIPGTMMTVDGLRPVSMLSTRRRLGHPCRLNGL